MRPFDRVHLFTLRAGLALVCLGAGAACVDTSAGRPLTVKSFCEERAEVDCRVYWDCFDVSARDEAREERAAQGLDIGQDRRQCVSNLKAACATQPFACPMRMVFQELKAGACIDALEGLSCADWNGGGAAMARACDSVCTPSTLNP